MSYPSELTPNRDSTIDSFYFDPSVSNSSDLPSTPEISHSFFERLRKGNALDIGNHLISIATEVYSLPIRIIAICALCDAFFRLSKIRSSPTPKHREELEEQHQEIKRMELHEIIKKYGWGKIFKEKIISQSEFNRLYKQHVKSMEILPFLEFYQEAFLAKKTLNSSYQIPPPSEQTKKWHAEASIKNFDEIAENYPVKDLYKIGVIPSTEMDYLNRLLEIYERAKKECGDDSERLKKNYF